MKPLRPKDLRKKQHKCDAKEEEGIRLLAENSADQFSEGTGGCLVGECLLEFFREKGDSRDMAEFVCEQFVTVVD